MQGHPKPIKCEQYDVVVKSKQAEFGEEESNIADNVIGVGNLKVKLLEPSHNLDKQRKKWNGRREKRAGRTASCLLEIYPLRIRECEVVIIYGVELVCQGVTDNICQAKHPPSYHKII